MPPRPPLGGFVPAGRPIPEEADRMVAVDDLNPPEEAKIKTEPMGVHTGAPPKEALAERAGARGTSADVLPEEGYGEAEGIAYAVNQNRAGARFRRFSAGLHTFSGSPILRVPTEKFRRSSKKLRQTCRGSRTHMTALRTCTVRWRSEVTSTSFQAQGRRQRKERPNGRRNRAHLSHRQQMTYESSCSSRRCS